MPHAKQKGRRRRVKASLGLLLGAGLALAASFSNPASSLPSLTSVIGEMPSVPMLLVAAELRP